MLMIFILINLENLMQFAFGVAILVFLYARFSVCCIHLK